MRLSLREILEMKQHNLKIPGRIPGIRVNVLEQVKPLIYIIQDPSTLAILKIPEKYQEEVEIGKSLVVAPVKLDDFCIGHRSRSPLQKLPKQRLVDPDEKSIRDLKQKIKLLQESFEAIVGWVL